MKATLKGRLTRLFCILFLIVLIIWGVFFLHVSSYIYREAESQLLAATRQITNDLNREFSAMEKLGYQLSKLPALYECMAAQDTKSRFGWAEETAAVLHGSYNLNFVSDIIAMNRKGDFYRFAGELSNASCAYLARQLQTADFPNRISVDTLGGKRLGYVVGVYDARQYLQGYLLIMTDEEKLLEMMYSPAFDGVMAVGIASGEELVAYNSSALAEQYAAYLENPQSAKTLVHKQMGLTSFEAVAALDKQYLRASTIFFSIAATVTLLAFALVLLLFVQALQLLFVKPMLGLMENAKQIGVGQAHSENLLAYTGQEDFDRLTDQINRMILRLEENSQRLLGMQSRVQQAELDKQHALIIALKKQINAHFTVNTLNVIRRLNELGENEKASEMCDGLSMLLRYANGAEDSIGGLEEIQVLERYVDIMQIRYPGRFTVSYDIDDQLDDVRLPRMLVQPIIENAVVHGLLGMDNGRLALSARVEDGRIIFSVRDNGRGIPQRELEALQEKIRTAPDHPWSEEGIEHIALPNIPTRVVSLFGQGYGLAVFSTPGMGTQVILTLPAQSLQGGI